MHKPRLRRLDWVFARDPIYFVTTATANRQRILANANIHDAFVDFAVKAGLHGVFVGRYVLMPDHWYVFVGIDETGPTLSAWMKSLKNSLSKVFRDQSIPAPHWQKGFLDHVLRSEESYGEKWAYVAQNPVRHGLVRAAADWPYQGEIHTLERR